MSLYRRASTSRQAGAALFTGMIFVVVLNIIVITALRGTLLQERMAANALNRQIALQAAEAALRDAEASIGNPASINNPPFDPFDPTQFTTTCANGRCRDDDADGLLWKTLDWGTAGKTVDTLLDGVPQQPRYIIEVANIPTISQAGGFCRVLYRITAQGFGRDNSVVYVQSMFQHFPARCD